MATCGMRFQTLLLGRVENIPNMMKAQRAIYGSERRDVVIPLPPDQSPQLSYWSQTL